MRFTYNYSFIPSIKTIYKVMFKTDNIPKIVANMQSILVNGNSYYTNSQFLLYTFDPIRLSDIKVKTGYDKDTDTDIVNPHCNLFSQMITIPGNRGIHTNSFTLMKVQIHKDEEDKYNVLSYGVKTERNILYFLK